MLRTAYHGMLFAAHSVVFPLRIWNADGPATLLNWAAYAAKLLLGLFPPLVLLLTVPRWRLLSGVYALGLVVCSVTFVRACPSPASWILLAVCSLIGALLSPIRLLHWAIGLPLIPLVILPILQHEISFREGAGLAARCAANSGERPSNINPEWYVPRYHGAHLFSADRLLVTGETSLDGRFLGFPHTGYGSWWLRIRDDHLWIDGPSKMTGNLWTSCAMGEARWFVRAGVVMRLTPPRGARPEKIERFPFEMVGWDAPDVACDDSNATVFASDLFDGRLVEVSPGTGGQARRRSDSLGRRGGMMEIRQKDGRLVMLDLQDLVVYSPAESRVLQRTSAAAASNSLALCQADGTAVVPDLAGRLRVFRMNDDGTYSFDWGIQLFAPRFAAFSPNCAYLAVSSADDQRVWIIDRERRQVIKEFKHGPSIRGMTFVAPRELVVVDACLASLVRF